MKDKIELDKLIEGILFAYGNPISIKKIATLTKKKEVSIEMAIEALRERLRRTSGLRIIKRGEKLQLVSAKGHTEFIEKLFKKERREELTRAALEVLAIVSYQGPVKKVEIEIIRGVNSSYILRNLTLRGLVTKLEIDGMPRYELSFGALRQFGLAKQEDLPGWEQIRQEIKNSKDAISKTNT